MDPNYVEFQKELVLSNVISHIEAAPARAFRHQITFNFSFKHKYRLWITSQDSTELQFLGDSVSSTERETKSICKDVPTIDSHWKSTLGAAVFEGLQEFSLSYLERSELSQVASDIASDNLVQASTNHRGRHHLRLDLDLMMEHDIVFEESSHVDWTNQQAAEAAMVPATDACIESLKSETIGYSNENHGSCVVCLEDFEAGCENVVTMPCSHIFHGECIKKWLRTSHYCPVCRYDMPTD